MTDARWLILASRLSDRSLTVEPMPKAGVIRAATGETWYVRVYASNRVLRDPFTELADLVAADAVERGRSRVYLGEIAQRRFRSRWLRRPVKQTYCYAAVVP